MGFGEPVNPISACLNHPYRRGIVTIGTAGNELITIDELGRELGTRVEMMGLDDHQLTAYDQNTYSVSEVR